MTPFIKVYLSILLVSLSFGQKNSDENKAYEFGFTIDGEQHRHEKKDVNGIIQGEFGFITADGIYHVTVYATDENGNFKILSMRNIRISAPLDGSPLPPGAKIEHYPGAGKLNQVPEQKAVQKEPHLQIDPRLPEISTTTKRTTFVFTTQPTIKPACAGCGYVTTPKPRPGERFPFQTPAFQKPNQQSGTIPNQQNPGSNLPTQNAVNYPQQNQNGFSGNSGISGPTYPSSQNNPTFSNQNGFSGNSGISGPSYPSSQNNPTFSNQNEKFPSNSKFNPPAANGINQDNGPRKPLSQVSVSNGAIHVPGNPDIQIRDKFPGMTDGLPNGVTEKDVTDLLYKFNYTVGFHGHYEKGLKNGAKVGGYFVTGRDGISRIVTYIADENGFRPKVKFVRLDLASDEVPKEGSEKTFGLKNFEFVWYPIS